jgi:hypothetical protein
MDYATRQPHFFRQDAGGSNLDHGCATGRSYPDINTSGNSEPV